MPGYLKKDIKKFLYRVVLSCSLLLCCLCLSACFPASKRPAPVVNLSKHTKRVKTMAHANTKVLQSKGEHIVQGGETLFSIARKSGQDPQNLAILNGIHPPYKIMKGQKIVLSKQKNGAQTKHSLPNSGKRPEIISKSKRSNDSVAHENKQKGTLGGSIKNNNALQKNHPKSNAAPTLAATSGTTSTGLPKKQGVATTQSKNKYQEENKNAPKSTIQWRWPAQGRIVRHFQSTGKGKGIDIAGTLGKPIKAAASGVVVYSGNGLKGYGNLIIIKHNEDFLSAYAHNRELMVKEGERVGLGQEIARMGQTDAEQVKVHFEIRYKGKPVNPIQFLPKV